MGKFAFILIVAALVAGLDARADENRAYGGIRAYAGYLKVVTPSGQKSDPVNNRTASADGLAFGSQFFLLNPLDPMMIGIDAGYLPSIWEYAHYTDANRTAYWRRGTLSAIPVHAVVEVNMSGFAVHAGLGAAFMHYQGYFSDGSVVDDTTSRFSFVGGMGFRVFLGEGSTALDVFARLYVVPGLAYDDFTGRSRKTLVCLMPGVSLNFK